MSALLQADNISYQHRNKSLVQNCSLTLKPGQITTVIGPNGAGKSTFLKLLTGELLPTSGIVTSFGHCLHKIPTWRLACRRSVMAQTQRLSFPFIAHDVVRLGAECIGHSLTKAVQTKLVEDALEQVDATHLAMQDYQTLSGGEQQHVQFARVLCQLSAGRMVEPSQALFLDEPIASLDLSHQIKFLNIIQKMAYDKGVAVYIILHDLNLAAQYADRLIILHHGKIIAQGSARDVMNRQMLQEVFSLDMQDEAELVTRFGPFILPQLCKIMSPQR